MENNKGYDVDEGYPAELTRDPFSERTIYDVEKTTFKNLRKIKKTREKRLNSSENKV